MAHPQFKIFKGKDKQFYFHLTAKNAEIILASEGYKALDGCKNGIDSVKKNANDDKRYEKKSSKDNQFYFVLKAANGEVIGKSETYKTEQARDNGIASVKENAPLAVIVEE